MLSVFEQALIMHLIGDWLLQNHWMAENKTNLRHPAAWVHGAIHMALLAFVFGPVGAVVLGLIHMLVDTRAPLNWWRRTFRMTMEGPYAQPVATWADQVLHIVCLAAWVQFALPVLHCTVP